MNWSLNHARLGALASCLGIFCALMAGCPVSAAATKATAATPAATPTNGKLFATVFRVRGEVAASLGGTGKERPLRAGDPIYVGDRVRSRALAEAVLKTGDAGFVAIRPGSEFLAEQFAAEDKPTDSITLRLVTGSLRVISGWIAHTNRAGNTVVTSTAAIGIRGTDHEPYVLSAELARTTANPEGTYDKVNRGGTTLQVGDNKLDIDAGQVGFVRAAGKRLKDRALLTILLPVLLDKVPNFYVPGEFDAELDRYSQTADEDSLRQLEQRRKGSAAAPVARCAPADIAKTWLAQLDAAIAGNDAPAVVAMFAPEAAVRATVRNSDGSMTSVDLGREELARSTLAAMKGLTNYTQRRVSIDARQANADAEVACDHISLSSVVIEQGRQSGKPYRFESREEYLLELRAGKWIAVKAATTQQ